MILAKLRGLTQLGFLTMYLGISRGHNKEKIYSCSHHIHFRNITFYVKYFNVLRTFHPFIGQL